MHYVQFQRHYHRQSEHFWPEILKLRRILPLYDLYADAHNGVPYLEYFSYEKIMTKQKKKKVFN